MEHQAHGAAPETAGPAAQADGEEQFVEVDNPENPRFGRVSLLRRRLCQLPRPEDAADASRGPLLSS